ncbi:iron-only hydrogenase system regulator [candidate division WOR-3 bacterium]|nr:iron-only hydrogenase system regulator [candidate division WOR-3 bacterium]
MPQTEKSCRSSKLVSRLGVVGIFIYSPDSAREVNNVLSEFSMFIKGRLGIPSVNSSPKINVIAVVFEGTTDELGSLTGKLGNLEGVETKTLLSKREL